MFNYNKFRELRKKIGYLQSDIAKGTLKKLRS